MKEWKKLRYDSRAKKYGYKIIDYDTYEEEDKNSVFITIIALYFMFVVGIVIGYLCEVYI